MTGRKVRRSIRPPSRRSSRSLRSTAAARIYRQAVRGEHIAFAAAGVRLWTAASISGGRYRSGTSFATAFVTAAFAVARARDPEKPAAELIDALAARAVDLGQPGRDPIFGFGLVQSAGCCTASAAGVAG